MSEKYDIIIIGAGPAGLTAGIYAGRAGRKPLILEKGCTGGRAALTERVVNYPGFAEISGSELMEKMREQAETFGAEIRRETVKDIGILPDGTKLVKTRRNEYETGAVIIASGNSPRKLGIKGEQELTGRGVSYCAACDAEFFRGQTVVVIGSGDQAVEESELIARFANKVIIVSLHDEGVLDCNRLAAQRAADNPKLSFIWNSTAKEILGEDSVKGVLLKNIKNGKTSLVDCQGVFLFVGAVPNITFAGELFGSGYIETDENTETSVNGIFAAGDIRRKSLRQISTAIGEGAISASSADRYLTETELISEITNSSFVRPQRIIFWSSAENTSFDTVCSSEYDVREIDIKKNPYIAKYFSIRESDIKESSKEIILKNGIINEQI